MNLICLNIDKEKTAHNTGLASGGLTFKRESSCGLSRPNAKPRTVGQNLLFNAEFTLFSSDSI